MTGKLFFESAGQLGIKEHPHLAAFTIQKAEGGHAGSDAIVELALDRRRGAWQAGVKRVQRIASVLAQSAEERHAPRSHRCFQLTPGQAVDLNQEQAGFFAGAFAGGQPQMTNSPFVAAETPTKTMPKGFNGRKHDESNGSRGLRSLRKAWSYPSCTQLP